MSASCKITNNTGVTIIFTNISKVNDDATWSIQPLPHTKIANGESCQIAMGNNSIFPTGVGFKASFVDANLQAGIIYLDDPAVGEHHFTFNGNFRYTESNPNGNSYYIAIQQA